ncbi:class I SAM-dependent methyltransferase [Desulfonatronum sp. SC1]|uniref:class I SAM-dependent methyltransferase n=1 Tax=Desulfonatronum sp. SC1 TaxID=2109626 RepID=UPI000D2F80DC|nr:class I SAM-dependent methyltransferase [Desulfonatronum sp. SC1]PTN34158.1 hypothetical protein C6366_13530 [Desulfonatronum sp. SC1]
MRHIIETLEQDMAQGKNIGLYEHVRGYLHPAEGYMLMLMAAFGEGEGEVVEIGSFHGKSTCYLAHGLRMRKSGVVHAVDHFQGSPEHQAGATHEEPALVREKTLYKQFMKNIQDNGFSEYVRPVVADSISAAKNWDKPIRLLFIDGDHSYKATRHDFETWSAHVTDQSYIGFHDVGPSWPGVTRFFNEITESGKGGYRVLLAVGSLRVVRRV